MISCFQLFMRGRTDTQIHAQRCH